MRYRYATWLASATFYFASLCMFCGAVGATTTETSVEPNFVLIKDALKGVEIVWDMRVPGAYLTYTAGGISQIIRGEALNVEQTSIGKVVTVTIAAKPDVEYTTLSFLLPNMKLSAPEAVLSFKSMAIVTKHRTPSLALPVSGVVDIYRAPVFLKGVAKVMP